MATPWQPLVKNTTNPFASATSTGNPFGLPSSHVWPFTSPPASAPTHVVATTAPADPFLGAGATATRLYGSNTGLRGTVGGTTDAAILGMPVALRQKFLRSHGYDVDVDGVLGRQTQTATNAFLKGTPAATWNHAWAASHAATAAPPTSSSGGAAPAAAAAPPGGGSAGTSTSQPPGTNPLTALLQNFANSQPHPLSFQQQMQLAQTQAKAQLAPQLAANRGQMQQALLANQQAQAQAQQDATRNATQQAGIAGALARILKGQGPATAAAYQNAAANTGALAQGFSGDLAQTAQTEADSANAYLQGLGAPAGQMIDPAKGKAAANVLYGLGGYLPGASLEREGAAFTAAANAMPATAIGRGQQLASDALRAGTDERSKLRQDLAAQQAQIRGDATTIQAGRPALVQSALGGIQTQANQDAALAQNNALLPFVLADKFEQFPGINPITGTPTKPTRDAGLAAAKIRAANAPKFSASASRALGYRADSNGNPTGRRLQILPGFKINNKGQVVKATAGRTSAREKPLSQTQRVAFATEADSAARAMKDGVGDAPSLDYGQAVAEFDRMGYFKTQQKAAIAMSAIWKVFGRPGDTISHTRPKGH